MIMEIAFGAGLGGVAGGLAGTYLRDYGLRRRVSLLEAEQERVALSLKGAKGNAARVELEEETDALLADIAIKLKGGELTKENAVQIIGELATKYPRAAMRIVKKGGLDIAGLKL